MPKTGATPKVGAFAVQNGPLSKEFIQVKIIPQGLNEEQFNSLSKAVTQKANSIGLGDDIVVQGSYVTGKAKPNSDIDLAIRLPQEQFDAFLKQRFKSPNPGSAKEKTMLHAIQTGKIQAGEAGLSSFRRQLEGELGMEVDLSVILKQGSFDNGPVIPLWK